MAIIIRCGFIFYCVSLPLAIIVCVWEFFFSFLHQVLDDCPWQFNSRTGSDTQIFFYVSIYVRLSGFVARYTQNMYAYIQIKICWWFSVAFKALGVRPLFSLNEKMDTQQPAITMFMNVRVSHNLSFGYTILMLLWMLPNIILSVRLGFYFFFSFSIRPLLFSGFLSFLYSLILCVYMFITTCVSLKLILSDASHNTDYVFFSPSMSFCVWYVCCVCGCCWYFYNLACVFIT